MLKKHQKYFTPEFLAENTFQEKADLQDPNVLKILDALTKLKKELSKNGWNFGEMYANKSYIDGQYVGVIHTDAECSSWMIKQYLPDGVSGEFKWTEGRYYWAEKHYWPPELCIEIQFDH